MIQTKIDFLIVGQGLAGTFFAYELIKKNKNFVIIDNNYKKASNVSAGIYNPVVLKRFVPIWQAQNQYENLLEKIKEIESFFKEKLLYDTQKVLRIFHDQEEFYTWKQKKQNPELFNFLDDNLYNNKDFKNPFGLGKVVQSGRVDVPKMINLFRNYFIEKNILIDDFFDYSEVSPQETFINYKNIQAKNIVFCEGFQVKNNPFFNYIPILTDKGEYLQIKLSRKIDDFLFKKKHFLFNYNQDFAYLGGTYNPKDTTENTTNQAKEMLIDDLNEMIDFNYEIKNHFWGFRPVSKDRRPILGKHHKHNNMFILNGLGTRGTLLGATFAKHLLDFILENKPLIKEVDSLRFIKN